MISQTNSRPTDGSSWRLQLQPLPRPQPPNIPVNPRDICPGDILWLRAKELCAPGNYVCIRQQVHEVVTGIAQRSGSTILGDLTCTIIPIDTWRHTPLGMYMRRKPHLIKFQETIPIFLQADEDTQPYLSRGGRFLFLARGRLPEQSYVSYQHLYNVPIASLRGFSSIRFRRAFDVRLSSTSYQFLTTILGIESQIYEEVHEVIVGSRERLRQLALLQSRSLTSLPSALSGTTTALNPNALSFIPTFQLRSHIGSSTLTVQEEWDLSQALKQPLESNAEISCWVDTPVDVPFTRNMAVGTVEARRFLQKEIKRRRLDLLIGPLLRHFPPEEITITLHAIDKASMPSELRDQYKGTPCWVELKMAW